MTTGYSAEEIDGNNCRFLQGADTDRETVTQLRDAIQNEQQFHGVLLNYRKDGTPFWNELSVSPVYDEDGKLTHFVGVQTDVTRRSEAERERDLLLEQQKRIADTLQRALLLDPHTNDNLRGVDISMQYIPSSEEAQFGGDFYDTVALSANKIALVVGDCTGKGLKAAQHTAEVKYALRVLLREYGHPTPALHRLNTFLLESQEFGGRAEDALVCVSVAVMDTDTGALEVAAAGMEAPLVIRADGVAEPIDARGAILGVDRDATYRAENVLLGRGDTFILVTDGITEARSPSSGRSLFGYDRFTRAAQNARSESEESDHISEQVVVAARNFAQGRLQDDVCVLVAKRSLTTEVREVVQSSDSTSGEAGYQAGSSNSVAQSAPNHDLALFAFEVTGMGYWELNIATGIATRSRRHDQIFGYETPPLTWTYEQFLSHVYPPDRAEVDALYSRALALRTDWKFECRITRSGDGAERWIEAHGRHFHDPNHGDAPTRIIGTIADITQRKVTALKLEDARREISETWARVTDAFVALDSEWRFTFVNPAAEDLLGSTAKTLMHRNFWNVFESARGTVVEQECLRSMQEQFPVRFEHYFSQWSAWFEARVFPSPNGVSLYFRDITSQKEAAAEHRTFLKQMMFGLTEGKVRLCDTKSNLPPPLALVSEHHDLDSVTVRAVRRSTRTVMEQIGFTQERIADFETAVGEAAMNAVRHAEDITCEVRADYDKQHVQVWVRDKGTGIAEHLIHRAMERGWTTGGFGQGMFLMHRLSDCFYLLTGASGTTVVLEVYRVPPPPAWLSISDEV